ncbi:MAG TPA: ABC transporter permease subunit [Anaerolineales bacterium]|nr:ABC transporter permease subunit [Anaerolineales bacterium]
MIVYAYGFEITQIDLAELRSEQRQTSLVRVLRALAQPEFLEFEREEQAVVVPVYVPCPAEGSLPKVEPAGTDGQRLTIDPACGSPGDVVRVEGAGFFPHVEGPVRFVPGSDPANSVQLGRDVAQTDGAGSFSVSIELPDRQSEDVQYIRATMRRNVGAPQITRTARDTWGKIIETVFLALLATTFGTALAIPLSFLAARNLMKPIRSPLASIALSALGWPAGVWIGLQVVTQISRLSTQLAGNSLVNLGAVLVSAAAGWTIVRWAMPPEEKTEPGRGLRMARVGALLGATLLGFFGLLQLAEFTAGVSLTIQPMLGLAGFLATFLFQVSDILRIGTPLMGALVSGSVVGNLLGRIGQRAAETRPAGSVRLINLVTAAAAGATIFALTGALIEWLYQIGRPEFTLWIPMAVGSGLGLILALFSPVKSTLPVGLVIYSVTRTILNSLRSVEALVMAIVFVIAVGIGPFAGVMALGLHTIVSLAKLYSEQVESILPGPLEAIRATGANRLQTIVYAVVPQIIPPYISYTMYRWDINVRMSTIIGFVGGGGIGFLLQQNINLLNYRAASAQMVVIAVVVSIMDYLSSVMRERYT